MRARGSWSLSIGLSGSLLCNWKLGKLHRIIIKSVLSCCYETVNVTYLKDIPEFVSANNGIPNDVAHQLANEFLAQLSSQIVNDLTRNTESLQLMEDSFHSNERLTFHERCGSLVKLSNSRRTAERRRPLDEFNNGVVMTNRPLKDDELFEVK